VAASRLRGFAVYSGVPHFDPPLNMSHYSRVLDNLSSSLCYCIASAAPR
jgi:hypothetical protein